MLLANGGMRPIEAISLLWNENSRVGHGLHQQQQQQHQQQQQGFAPPPIPAPHQLMDGGLNPMIPQPNIPNANPNPFPLPAGIPLPPGGPPPLFQYYPPNPHHGFQPQQQQQHHPPAPPQHFQVGVFAPRGRGMGRGVGHVVHGHGHVAHGHGHGGHVAHGGHGGHGGHQGPGYFPGGRGGGPAFVFDFGGDGGGGGPLWGNGNGNGNGGGGGGNGNAGGNGNGNGNGGGGGGGGGGNGNGVTTSVLDAILRLSKLYPRLRMLAVETGEWEDEVLHAVCRLFPFLERLKLTYFGEGPDEVRLSHSISFYHCFARTGKKKLNPLPKKQITVGSIGPHFLTRLPHLQTFQTYQVQKGIYIENHPAYLFDPTYETIEDEMRDLVIPWNRYCRELREVQVDAGWRMVRGWEGGRWRVEKVREEREEGLEV